MVSPPTPGTVLLSWQFDPAMLLLASLLIGLYSLGIIRLSNRERPVRWPPQRSVAFFGGVATLAFATQSGLARYDTVLFSYHIAQHVLLGMVAPLLFALGAPITLALQASRRPTQRTLLAVLNNRVVGALSQPIVAWVLFGGTLFGFYFSPLFELSLRNDLLHQAVHLHFVAVGCAFAWAAVGIDPVRHQLSYPARMLFVLLAVPFHAFLGLALLGAAGGSSTLGGGFYSEVARNWGPSVLADQRTGAGIMWAAGELFGLLTGAVVFRQWYLAESRRQIREDRRLDRESTLVQ